MAAKIAPSSVALPKCCAKPVTTVNDTTGKAHCRCGATCTFSGAKWETDKPAAK